ncbi:hypothetical protein CN137_33900, partial [Sinorhizobium meliloti]
LATNRFTVHLRQIATTYLVILIVAPSHPNCRAIPGHLGRLLLAARQGNDLVYVGGCGTGWSHDLSRELRNVLASIATNKAAVSLRRKNAVFTEPMLVAEVEYRAWTDDGKLRHASFKGIRPREDEAAIYELRSH